MLSSRYHAALIDVSRWLFSSSACIMYRYFISSFISILLRFPSFRDFFPPLYVLSAMPSFFQHARRYRFSFFRGGL